MRLNPLILLGILPLAACSHAGGSTAHASTPPPVAAEGVHECQPDKLEAFTGRLADEATVKQLVAASGARNARVVKPGMAVTMDFRQDRVTVQVDAQNRIERANCG
jgi:hypothetical protein